MWQKSMNDKTPSKRKIADITKTQKTTANKSPQIILEKRSHIDNTVPDVTPVDTPTAPAVAPAVKRSITPLQTAPAVAEPAPSEPVSTKDTPAVPAGADTASTADITEAAETPAQTDKATPTANSAKVDEPAVSDDTDTSVDEKSDTSEEAVAAQKAAEAEQQQKKVDKYIDTREFFVPIDAAAHKRSVQVSLWLTLVYIILSVILVDLMLDSGMIELLQKVPHTNFFRT